MAEEEGASVSGSSKKRVLNKAKWKKTIRKVNKNSGLKYVNTKNQDVREKTEPQEVSLTKIFCHNNINYERIIDIYTISMFCCYLHYSSLY